MRALRWIGITIGGLALTLAVLLWLIDTSIGHRLIVDQIAKQTPASGLRIRIGRLDGSIYSDMRLRDVRFYDTRGIFLRVSDARIDWTPADWLINRLNISSIRIPAATLKRWPKLRASVRKSPILPGFDIRIGTVRIDRMVFDTGASGGQKRVGNLVARVEIHKRRALVTLNARASAGDRIALNLDAEPDGNRFAFDADLAAPAGGVLGQLTGTERPVATRIEGKGDWTRWRGQLLLDVSGGRIAQLSLTNNRGKFSADGRIAVGPVARGKLQRLTAPSVRLKGSATLADRKLDTAISLASQALTISMTGRLDLGANRFSPFTIDARLLEPKALFPNMSGRDIRLQTRLDGPFSAASFDYLLTAPLVAFDTTGFEAVRASGQGRLGRSPVTVPLSLTAKRITGAGEAAGGILANISVAGPLSVTAKTITGDGLLLKSDKLSARLTLFVDLVTGSYDVGLAGRMERYLIPGLGIVDVRSELKVMPGAAGRGTQVVGRGQAWVRRLDNRFLASLTGGLPKIETGLSRGPDGIIRLVGLKLIAPDITLGGNGYRRRDGTFHFEGAGAQARYGPVARLVLDGPIERPRVELLLSRPNEAMALRDVRLVLSPDASGFAWQASGGSRLGGFGGNGAILLPAHSPASIRVDTMAASGLTARGSLAFLEAGLSGQLVLGGSGQGTLGFSPAGKAQKIIVQARLRDAVFSGQPEIRARRASIDGVMMLAPGGSTIEGAIQGRSLSLGGLALARMAANVKLVDGAGEVRAAFAGSRGRNFDLQTVARLAPNRLSLVGSGTIDRRPVRLSAPAEILFEASGWRLRSASLDYAGGTARISGFLGDSATDLEADIKQMPLAIASMIFPKSGLGGSATGTIAFHQRGGESPSGRADLRIGGLTRSGLVLTSRPVDVGVTAVLAGNNAAARAVAVSSGVTIGRAQARIQPLQNGDLASRLTQGNLFAQLRFNGAADTLWRLAGIEGFDVSGPVAIGADITGTIADPLIRGSLRTANARLESAATGFVLGGIKADGRFSGSKLVIDSFSGSAGAGTITGQGSFDFTTGQKLGMSLTLQANQAVLLARDDLSATATGPIAFKSDGRGGGVISGDLDLLRSSYRLGKATATGAIPSLNVRHVNAIAEDSAQGLPASPWRLDITARARNRLMMTGLGIDSEWRTDLRIAGSVTEPAITGRADMLRGDYQFAGRRFELQRGTIRFQREVPPDPVLDIVAKGDTQGVSASILVTGTGQRPEIKFTSVPALPEDELLSRLLFGTSITNLSAPEAIQLAAAVASLQRGATGLNPINILRDAVGLDRLRILPADTVTGADTAVAAGKYLSRKLYVEIITDGQGYSATRAEFQVTRWLSILSSISTIGRQSASVRISRDY